MFVADDRLSKTRVELYTTSTASDIKTKKDCYRLRSLLEAKKIDFFEVIFLSFAVIIGWLFWTRY